MYSVMSLSDQVHHLCPLVSGHDVGGHDVGGHDVGGHDVGGHDVGGHDVSGHDVGYDVGLQPPVLQTPLSVSSSFSLPLFLHPSHLPSSLPSSSFSLPSASSLPSSSFPPSPFLPSLPFFPLPSLSQPLFLSPLLLSSPYLSHTGDMILKEDKVVQITPLQLYCIKRRMVLPVASSGRTGEEKGTGGVSDDVCLEKVW